MNRIQILRDRIFELKSRLEPLVPTLEYMTDYANFMGCSLDEAKEHFKGAYEARREQRARIIAQLEAELAAEIAKQNAPNQQRQPRKK